ncbi:MAG: S-adenosylhomocysteine deaminase [Candidatus Cloacimonadota bacterium]|nr:MAG: S-adenosylhomocysteine deaminase [Candidatus Cloacimonadota bacterium]PIE80182.1 MAG: S-adenosylhomocysteine deaminase [Candidatus Delongbacteria bacterium]
MVYLNREGEKVKKDILIKNGLIVTVDNEMRVIDNGFVSIKESKIVEVGEMKNLQDCEADKIIDAKGGIVMPGLVNTHCHAPMTLLRGYADDYPLMDWLNNYIWPIEREFINKDTVEIGTRLAVLEMIKSGTTIFNDMYFFEEVVGNVCKEAGMRVVIGEGVMDLVGVAGEMNFDLLDKFKDDELVVTAVANHAPYTCSPELMKRSSDISTKYNVPYHIHLSETETEFNDIKKDKGLSPVEYLESIGALNERMVAVHSVVLTDKDLEIYKKYNVGVSHNVESNLKLASGVARIPDMLKMGIKVGLGTDGTASNNNLDMFEEMATAAKLHKAIAKDPTVLKAEEIVRVATMGGAEVLSMSDKIGSIEVGKKADIIIIDTDKPHLTPLYNPYSHLAYSVQGSDVSHTIINGKLLMENRNMLTINEKQTIEDVNSVAKKIKEFKNN